MGFTQGLKEVLLEVLAKKLFVFPLCTDYLCPPGSDLLLLGREDDRLVFVEKRLGMRGVIWRENDSVMF